MRLLARLLPLLLVIVACGPATINLPGNPLEARLTTELQDTATPDLNATPALTPLPSPTPTSALGDFEKAWENFPPNINPLTGLVVADPSILERRPVSVKISNYPRSNRPQWGLTRADIVYEYYHNNDLTRFYAIYYGQDAELAGPIRSGRLMDSYLMDIYESDLVFASADQRVLDRFEREQLPWQMIAALEGDCPPNPVCRVNPAEENFLLTDTSVIGDYAIRHGGNDDRPDLHGMSFSQAPPAGGEPLDRIYFYYSYSAYSYFQYDPQTDRYLRYQDAQEDLGGRGVAYEPLRDQLTNQQVAADTVVLLLMPHFHYFYAPGTDTVPPTEVVDMDFEGEGTAYAFRDGQAYMLEWVHNPGELVYLVDENGERWPFKPGTTWFQVMTDRSTLEKKNDGWLFDFVFRRP